MHRVLNDRTKTVHRGIETDGKSTACGSLTHVPDEQTRIVSDEDLGESLGVDYCGNCFEGAGGY